MIGVVVPIRAFSEGKSRLAPFLDPADRERLARAMADRVVAAADPYPVVVVSSASEVAEWAEAHRIEVVPDPGSLDEAAAVGVKHFEARGAHRIVIAHGDLPLAESFEPAAEPGDRRVAVLVPCHRNDGTTVVSIPADCGFRFSYGPGSFARHVVESRRLGLAVIELDDVPGLRHDVDDLDDLLSLDELP